MHRLPEKITNQTPQTEQHLMDFFGAAGGGLSQFWTRCIEIWGVTLEPYPAYAREVKKYFDLLLQSSLQGKRSDSAAVSVKPSVEPFEKHTQAACSGSHSQTGLHLSFPLFLPSHPRRLYTNCL